MKRIFVVSVMLLVMLSFSGCRTVNRVDDDVVVEDELMDEEIPQGTAVVVDDDYGTSVNEIDTRLYTTINDLDTRVFDENDENYLADRSDYYVKTSAAYETALNDLKKVNYTDTNKEYHTALMNYYQSGYDTYSGLSTRYSGFQTLEDEIAYRNDVGDDAFYIDNNIRSQYDSALQNLNIIR